MRFLDSFTLLDSLFCFLDYRSSEVLKVKSIKRKQPTLVAFGFKKTIGDRGNETEVKLPTEMIEVLYSCDNCERKFKSS